jgi:NAD(P)-dependent dehydrogenase (short-subunit alcohol dehydrogenase family)/acyl carrier protein
LKDGGVCLITGGLGGVGLTVARALAEAGPARLVLLGRTPLPSRDDWDAAIASGHRMADALKEISAIEATGSEVMVVACNVADITSVAQIAEQVRARWGGIDAIVHAAGLPGSGALAVRQTADDVSATLAAKVEGTRVLARVFREDRLDFVVLMSSINSIISTAGAIDYAAANAFLDAWAESEERPKSWSQVTVINWDAWAEVGMAARRLKERPDPNLTPIDREVAASLLLDFARGPVSRVVVTAYDLPTAALWARRQGLVLGVDPRALDTPESTAAAAEDSGLVQRDRFRNEAEYVVATIWAGLLQVTLDGPDDDFFELGGHSLMATRFLAQLEAATSVKLVLRDVFDARTIGNIANLVAAANHAGDSQDPGDEGFEEFLL